MSSTLKLIFFRISSFSVPLMFICGSIGDSEDLGVMIILSPANAIKVAALWAFSGIMISRKEAKELGLPVNNANNRLLGLVKQLITEYKNKLVENEKELILDFKGDAATIKKEYQRAYIETNIHTYTFITNYIFHKNGKVDKVINQWRQIK
ncbi:hypothetical protein ES705_50511 [subsurface metagenome]